MQTQNRSKRLSRDRTAQPSVRRDESGAGPKHHATSTTADALRTATGISDEEALRTLGELGFTPDTVRLLHLVPLVHVAWSEGGMTRRERKLIEDLALLRGIRYGSPAFKVLSEWVKRPLPEGHFEKSLRAIRASLDAMPDRMRSESLRSVVFQCTQVATASRESWAERDSISTREHAVLEHIVGALRN